MILKYPNCRRSSDGALIPSDGGRERERHRERGDSCISYARPSKLNLPIPWSLLSSLIRFKNRPDVGLLDEPVKVAEYFPGLPDFLVLAKDCNLFLRSLRELGAVLAEGLELVDKLANDIPRPLVEEGRDIEGLIRQNSIEESAIVCPRIDPVFNRQLGGFLPVTLG